MSGVTLKDWAEALRSGKYEQGRNWLRAGDRFCCHGVLCDLVAPDEWRTAGYNEPGQSHRLCTALPARSVLAEVGLSQSQACTLAELNDNGYSFAQIADEIEMIAREKQ